MNACERSYRCAASKDRNRIGPHIRVKLPALWVFARQHRPFPISATLRCIPIWRNAAFPHTSERHAATGSNFGAKDQAWQRICEQIAESASHRDLIGHLGVLFLELFRKSGACRLPMRIGPAVATQVFPCWSAIADLRAQKNGWAMSSSDPALKWYFEIV